MFRKKKITTARRRPGSGTTPGSDQKTPNVFSFHSSRSSERSNLGRGQTKQQDVRTDPRKKGWLKRTLRLVLVLGILALIASNLLLNREPKLVLISGNGKEGRAAYREEGVYQAAADEIFSESYFNTNKLTINTGRIEGMIKQEFPEIADVSVALPLIGHQPIVYMQYSAARLILSSPAGQTYVLDASGRAIASHNLADSLREAGLPVVRDQSALDANLGEIVIPSTTVAFITEVVRQFNAKDIEVASMELPPEPSELHVRLTGVGYYIKFNTRGNAREEAGAYLALRQYLEAQHQTPAEYVDVRVTNRVYYK